MLIDQAIFLLQRHQLPEQPVAERRATIGVRDDELDFVRRLLADGTPQKSPPCRVAVCKAPSHRFVILHLSDDAAEIRAFFLEEAVFALFDFQPFLLLDYAAASVSPRLEPMVVADKIPVRSNTELGAATIRWTAEMLGGVLDCVLTDGRLGVLLQSNARCLISALYQLLPRSCRRELSFNGLTASFSVYPFHFCLARDCDSTWKSLLKSPGFSVVSLDDEHSMRTDLRHPWSKAVTQILSSSGHEACLDFVCAAPATTTMADLRPLAQALAQNDVRCDAGPENITHAMGDHSGYCFHQDVHQPYQDQRSHNAFGNSQQLAMPKLDLAQREVLEQLDQLDDAVFDAIAGLNEGYARLEALWPQIRAHLASELVEESRDQYVRLIVDRCATTGD